MELVNSPRIVCLGEGMVEERVGADGRVVTGYGGDTLNIAIHLARLGFDVAYASALGSDAESDELLRQWQAEGLDCSLVLRHPERRAGRYRIALDADGERSFSYDRANSAARQMFALADDRWPNAVASADVLVFSLISLAILPDAGRDALLVLAETVIADGGAVAFDGNYRPALWEDEATARHWCDAAASRADFGFPTLDDEEQLGGFTSGEEVADYWLDLGCGEVVVKAGAKGCLVPDGSWLAPEKTLDPVDTSGAGDAFDAGYLAARLSGTGERNAAEAGHRLAGWTILRTGAIPTKDAAAPYG